MSKLDTQNISVLNYNENSVFVDTATNRYTFRGSKDGKRPVEVPMPLNEVKYIASNTNLIDTGWLTFEDEFKKEIFETYLKIKDWEEILTNECIEEILLHPTIDGLKKLIEITNIALFDRVRIVMHRLKADDADITMKVENLVNTRYKELTRRQRKSKIVITAKDVGSSIRSEEADSLRKQNEALQIQMEEMQRMMKQMMESQAATATSKNSNENVKPSGDVNSDINGTPKKTRQKKIT